MITQPLKVSGVGRNPGDPADISVYFNGKPSDDDLRRFHDFIRRFGPPAPLDVREEVARVLEIVARDGLPAPRDLDVALDAIFSMWPDDPGDLRDIIEMDFMGAGAADMQARAARIVGTRAHLSEAQDGPGDAAVSVALRYCEEAIQRLPTHVRVAVPGGDVGAAIAQFATASSGGHVSVNGERIGVVADVRFPGYSPADARIAQDLTRRLYGDGPVQLTVSGELDLKVPRAEADRLLSERYHGLTVRERMKVWAGPYTIHQVLNDPGLGYILGARMTNVIGDTLPILDAAMLVLAMNGHVEDAEEFAVGEDAARDFLSQTDT